MKTLFVFRQDLRLNDNLGLKKAIENSDYVVPIFILDTSIVDDFGGFNDKRFLFLFDALRLLDKELKSYGSNLFVFKGDPVILIPQIIKFFDCNSVIANRSYDKYGIKRDFCTKFELKKTGIDFDLIDDFLLGDLLQIKLYKVFTPYFRTFTKNIPKMFKLYTTKNIQSTSINKDKYNKLKKLGHMDIYKDVSQETHSYWLANGCLEKINNISLLSIENYSLYKNNPSKDHTTKLSVYIRFGLVSPRQIWNKVLDCALDDKYPDISYELGWRNFWHQLFFYEPEYLEKEVIINRRDLNWQHNKEFMEAFEGAKTGYPLVDAGIIQLKKENRISGRVRMVIASFFTKDMLMDWRIGEKFFKKYLLDYDESVNIGNWQRCASVGADPKPLRIFNPLLQSKRFDPDAIYIRKYIPELKDIPSKNIHDPINYDLGYAKPIFKHGDRVIIAKNFYKKTN